MKAPSFLSRRLVWIALFCILWAVALSKDLLPILRGGFGWDWKYKPVLELNRLLPLIIGMLLYIPIALVLVRRQAIVALLVWAIAAGVALTLAAVYVRGDILYRLYTITVSGRTGGWHMAAARIDDLSRTLQAWPAFMVESTSFSTHMGISPPGLVLLFYAVNWTLARMPSLAAWLAGPLRPLLCQYIAGYSNAEYASAWLGILMPVWGSLTVLPLYYFGRQTFGNETTAWSVAWWPLIPSFLIFSPLPNTFYALPSIIVIGLLLQGLRRGRMAWVFASGALTSLLTFLTFTFLPLLLFAGLLTLGVYWRKRTNPEGVRPAWHWPFQAGAWFGAGLCVAWILCNAFSGLGFLDVWKAADQAHLALDRPYWPWLGLHLNDFFMFTGWPVALLAGVGIWSVIQRLRAHRRARESDIVLLASALTVIILDLSGTLRGESGRILLFLAPWLLLAAAYALRGDRWLGGVLTVLEGLVAVVIIASLFVVAPEFKAHAAPVPPDTQLPAPNTVQSYSSGAEFGSVARLKSYEGKIETQDGKQFMVVWLVWQDIQSTDIAYEVSLEPIGPDGSVSETAYRVPPSGDAYPTTCWMPGQANLVERVRIPLDSTARGSWSVRLSLIDSQTGQPLESSTSEGSPSPPVELGPFQ